MFIIEFLIAIVVLAGSIFMLMVAIRLYDVLGLMLEVLRALTNQKHTEGSSGVLSAKLPTVIRVGL